MLVSETVIDGLQAGQMSLADCVEMISLFRDWQTPEEDWLENVASGKGSWAYSTKFPKL